MENYLICKPRFGKKPIYVFVDDKNCSATSLFFKHKVAIQKVSVMQNPKEKYQLVFCKIRSQDKGKFLTALAELPTKMQLIGNTDYEICTERLMGYLKSDEELVKYGKRGMK